MTARNITSIAERPGYDAAPLSIDTLIEARLSQMARDLLDDDFKAEIVEAVVERLAEDDMAIYRYRYALYSIPEIAECVGYEPETVSEWTRLPKDHPKYLPTINLGHLRVLPADFFAWLQRNRGQ